MKELSVEQKAKRYDEISNEVKNFFDGKQKMYSDVEQTLNHLFPELKESEDEKIRKWLIAQLTLKSDVNNPRELELMILKSIAWLEKQGEHANFLSKIQVGDKVTRNEGGVLVNISQLERVAKPRRVKPADKVEPKFNVGDWVVNSQGNVWRIDFLDKKNYGVSNKGKYNYFPISKQDEMRHWTIQDAKDGDVLQLGKVTAIFKEFIGNEHCECYCSVCEGEFEIPSEDNGDNIYGCYNATPATKEQCDLLFQKMKEEGYVCQVGKRNKTKI